MAAPNHEEGSLRCEKATLSKANERWCRLKPPRTEIQEQFLKRKCSTAQPGEQGTGGSSFCRFRCRDHIFAGSKVLVERLASAGADRVRHDRGNERLAKTGLRLRHAASHSRIAFAQGLMKVATLLFTLLPSLGTSRSCGPYCSTEPSERMHSTKLASLRYTWPSGEGIFRW